VIPVHLNIGVRRTRTAFDGQRAQRRHWRRLLIPAVLEAVLLTLGVALALAAEEWREGRQHRRQATAASLAITEEMRANRAAVAQSASYHASLLDSLRVRGSAGAAPSPALFRRGFVSPAQLSSAAWQTAAETGALEHIPHALVLQLSETYGPQQRYERQAESVAGLIYGELYRGGAEGITANHRNLGHLIGAFLYRERLLVRRYDSTLAALTPAPGARAD
jgi:hypothetical protein